jgi:hypothetical protein
MPCFSEDLTGKYYSENGYFCFVGNQYVSLKIDMETGTTEKTSGKFKLLEDSFENKTICFINENQKKENVRYFCFEDYLLLYKDSEIPFFIGNSTSAKKIESLVSIEVTASSFLKESNHIYSPEKITFWGNLNYVWAEGVAGQGIGEKLFLKKNAISKLYILPGYVSIMRPDLFKKNSRPKKVKVSTKDKELYFSLLDKPVFQVLDFGSIINEEMTIEILEVYPGTQFEDTCISSILCNR